MKRWCLPIFAAALLAALAPLTGRAKPDSFRFEILGDRTGEAQPGVYEEAWREAAADNPAFVVTVGDTIQGHNNQTARTEWTAMEQIWKPWRRFPLYLTPGNHDIWSAESEALFREHAQHAPHYSFDYGEAHFTILDNSRTEQFSAEELAFLEQDLESHAAQPLKFVVSHKPSWLFDAVMGNPDFAVQRLAKKYGVRFVIAGHLHEMLHADVDGVAYISMASSGGHLRASKKYEDGWFFEHTRVDVSGSEVRFEIHELQPPYGQGRVSQLRDWGIAGLADKRQ
ncbi:MAG: metallophosphoesterase [Bryobacteraceae bacterium]|jgi:predicted phosphodiesterase